MTRALRDPSAVHALFALIFAGALSACGGGPPEAPLPAPDWDPARLQVTRPELQRLEARYDSVARATTDGATARAAREAVGLIRARLERGDFRPGDRILLRVEGESELPDTLVVEPGPSVVIEDMGTIGLGGVLRSELEEHLTEEIARYVRSPVVTARALVRLSVQGSVGNPGFYVFPADMLLENVIMEAGGPSREADLDDMSVRRGERVLLEDDALRTALAEGRSIDQLNLQGGDEIEVPSGGGSPWIDRGIRWGVVIASTLLLGVRLF